MTPPAIFDAHVHVENGLDGYGLKVGGRNLIFNSVESYRRLRDRHAGPSDTVTLIFDFRSRRPLLLSELQRGRVQAVKIHSRIQRIREEEYDLLIEKLRLVPARFPVVVDAFYFGGELDVQPSLPAIARMLRSFPERRFVIAHCGGYRLLEYFFHLRKFDNVHYELSLILQMLEDSSAFQDLKKLIRFTGKDRILFGSDYPSASPERQYAILRRLFRELSIDKHDQERILHSNAKTLFGR